MTNATAGPRSPVTDALREIQAPVRDRLDAVAREIQHLVTSDLPMITQVSGHLMQMRGKMFRPTLTLLASDVEGASQLHAVTSAAVIEIMHLATLVHDDSVDHSAMRRGLPTVNAFFSHQIAVIMGDFLYSRALRALVGMRDFELLRVITEVSNELTLGEMRELSAVDTLNFSEEDYAALIRSKTASLLCAACESGALCGAPGYRVPLAQYGDRLGMAFQITDDILDYIEDESVTGKPSGNDLREHKVTLPLIAALPKLSVAGRHRVNALFADESPSDELIHDVVNIVTKAGGIEYARRRGEDYAREAESALAALPPSVARRALADAITYATDRRS